MSQGLKEEFQQRPDSSSRDAPEAAQYAWRLVNGLFGIVRMLVISCRPSFEMYLVRSMTFCSACLIPPFRLGALH